MPTLSLGNSSASKTLLVFGGFDSYLEELASWFQTIEHDLKDYRILIFDGPGQGHVPKQQMYFQANYEQVVKKILDTFQLSEVDAVGISWGGYFVMRAAAFEKRIKRAIAFDIFYSPLDTMRLNSGKLSFFLFQLLLACKQKKYFNRLVERKAQKTINFRWFLNNGYDITGETNPYNLLQNLKQHQLKDCLSLINQDCLLLAGTNDLYVPLKRLKQIQKQLVNAKKVETEVFTNQSGGSLHCQVDQLPLALDRIKNFLQT